jgi:Signal peptidase (SPase) II
VQWAFSSQQSPTQITTQFAYPGPQIAGNLNIVVVETTDNVTDGPVHLVDSVEDTAGNHYQFVPIDTLGNGLSHLSGPGFNIQQSIYFAVPIFGQLRNTVTVTFTDLAQLIDIRILEYSGVAREGTLHQYKGQSQAESSSGSVNYDQVRRGAVLDFIDLGWWPVFNFADAAITL